MGKVEVSRGCKEIIAMSLDFLQHR